MTHLEKLRKEFDTLLAALRELEDEWLPTLDEQEQFDGLFTHVEAVNNELKAVENEQKWIPVEENSMPEEGRMILVADSKRQVLLATFHAKSQSFTVYRFCGRKDSFLGQQIAGVYGSPTHWRPLPKGPEEIKGKTTP